MNCLMVSKQFHPPGGRVSPRAAAGEAGTLNSTLSGTLDGTLKSRRPNGRARLRPGRGRDKARPSRNGCPLPGTCSEPLKSATGSRTSGKRNPRGQVSGDSASCRAALLVPVLGIPLLTAPAPRANAFFGFSLNGTLDGTLSGTLEAISSREAAISPFHYFTISLFLVRDYMKIMVRIDVSLL